MGTAKMKGSPEARIGSLPLPLSERTWSGWLVAGVCATAGIGTWSFVVGGFTAYYVPAGEGTATMIAGALIGQLLVTLSQVPPVAKYGIETLASTKPQLGIRGSYFALIVQYATLIGWNCVLMIFFGRAVASVLTETGIIGPAQVDAVAITSSLIGAGVVFWLLTGGSTSLKYAGSIIAVGVSIIGLWMYGMLFNAYGLDAIAAAAPLAPIENDRLMNFAVGTELLILSTLGWWAYMGSLFRMLNCVSKGVVPSMLSLGFGWAAVGLIGLYSALVVGEPDPTVWMLQIAGPVAGVCVLVFVALANIGSALVGAHAATLGIGQIPAVARRVGWKMKAFIVLIPMLLALLFFPGPFYDNIGTFMAFIGIIIAPICGVQIVDWFVFKRLDDLDLVSLYQHDSRSRYWYFHGFNPAGITALVIGAVVYMLLLDPLTFVPNNTLLRYLTASIPSALAGAVTYWGLTKALRMDAREGTYRLRERDV